MSSHTCNPLLSLFSSALLDIQRLANDQGVEHFHDAMLTRLQGLVAFDPLTQLSEHLALYRTPGQPRFSNTDRMLPSAPT